MSEVVTAVVMNIPVFWNVMSCGLVYRYQCFRGTCAVIFRTLYWISLKMETKRSSETLMCHIPEDDSSIYYRTPHQILVPSELDRWSVCHSLDTATSVSLCTSRLRLQIRSGEGACKRKVTQSHECVCG